MDDFKNKTILLVEDEAANALLVKMVLNKSGINILHAKDGLEAINLYEKNKDAIKLILLDISIPILNGYEVCDKIREYNKRIPIIAFSANSDNKEYYYNKGFNGFIEKPFNIKTFINQINIYLN